MTNTLSL